MHRHVFLSLLLLLVLAHATQASVIELEAGQEDRCLDEEECLRTVWCFGAPPPLLPPLPLIWSDVVAHVHVFPELTGSKHSSSKSKNSNKNSSPDSEATLASLCVLHDSDDSDFGPMAKFVQFHMAELWRGLKKVAKENGVSFGGGKGTRLGEDEDEDDDQENGQGRRILSTIERLQAATPRTGSSFLLSMLPPKLSKMFFGCTSTDCVVHFSAIGQSCVRLCPASSQSKSLSNVGVQFQVENYTEYYFSLLVAGLLIFSIAPWLSSKIAFFYISGATIGVCLSLAILFFLIMRRVSPQSTAIWSLTLAALFQGTLASAAWFWVNLEAFVASYMDFLLIYIAITALISLAIVHYSIGGGEVRPALQDVVRWTFRLVGLTLMFRATSSARWSLIFASSFLTFPLIQLTADFLEYMVCCGCFCNRRRKTAQANARTPGYIANRMTPMQFEQVGQQETPAKVVALTKTPEFQRVENDDPESDEMEDNDSD